MEAFPAADVAAQLDTPVTAEPGSFIVFDSMLFHRAGPNVSDRPRRAVNQVFSVPIIAQQVSLPDALEGRHADDPALARLLGYEVCAAAVGACLARAPARAHGGEEGLARHGRDAQTCEDTAAASSAITSRGESSSIPAHNGRRTRRALMSSVIGSGPAVRPWRRPAGAEWSGT